jgi:metal-responsive CopG/Arc/MetJ family transcriptional regulator
VANVKTAISIQESLFRQMENLARRMHVSRSRLFAMATKDFLVRYQNRQILERLNAAYGKAPGLEEEIYLKEVRAGHRRLVEGEW